MFLIEVYLDRSPIEGIGVFTKHPLASGELIWRFDPVIDRLIPREFYEAQQGPLRAFLDRYCYPSRTDPSQLVYEGDDSRYMNHADGPNCDISDEKAMYTYREIRAGEELTCNYGVFFNDGGFELLGGR